MKYNALLTHPSAKLKSFPIQCSPFAEKELFYEGSLASPDCIADNKARRWSIEQLSNDSYRKT
jgi:hypothetical protein